MDEVIEVIDKELASTQEVLARWQRARDDHERARSEAAEIVKKLTGRCESLIAAKNILNGGC